MVEVAIEALGKLIRGSFKHAFFDRLFNFCDQSVLKKADIRDRLHNHFSRLLVLVNFPLKVPFRKNFLRISLRLSLLHLFREGRRGGLGRFWVLHCVDHHVLQALLLFLSRDITATFLENYILLGAEICIFVRYMWRLK